MDLIYKEITEKIIGALFEVHKNMGPGLTEIIYRRVLAHELDLQGLKAETEKECPVFYKGRNMGSYRADIIVEGKVVLELKATSFLEPIHEAQILSYLKTMDYEVGLLVNFGKKELEFKRFVYTKDFAEKTADSAEHSNNPRNQRSRRKGNESA